MKTISITWCVDDVLALDATLAESEAEQILEECLRKHDANIGINWDVIQRRIDSMKHTKEKGK